MSRWTYCGSTVITNWIFAVKLVFQMWSRHLSLCKWQGKTIIASLLWWKLSTFTQVWYTSTISQYMYLSISTVVCYFYSTKPGVGNQRFFTNKISARGLNHRTYEKPSRKSQTYTHWMSCRICSSWWTWAAVKLGCECTRLHFLTSTCSRVSSPSTSQLWHISFECCCFPTLSHTRQTNVHCSSLLFVF